MQYDPEQKTLTFSNDHEVEQFHNQVSLLLRNAMFQATKGIEDGAQAAEISKEVFKEFAIVTRALNTLRRSLPRHGQ